MSSLKYDKLMEEKAKRALDVDEIIYIIQYDPLRTPRNITNRNKGTNVISTLKSHFNNMSGFITPDIEREYLEKYNNKKQELTLKLIKLYEFEKRKNTLRQNKANKHGINSDEEIKESIGATNIRINARSIKEQLENLDKDKEEYFIRENDASIEELRRFYNLKPLNGGIRKTRSKKRGRRVTRNLRRNK